MPGEVDQKTGLDSCRQRERRREVKGRVVGGQREVKERQREGKERQWKDSGRAVEGQPEGQGKAHRIHSVCGRKTCAAAPQAKASVFGRVAAGAQGKAEGTLPKSVPSEVFSSPSPVRAAAL